MASVLSWKGPELEGPGPVGAALILQNRTAAQELNLGEVWEKIRVPVLVVRGSADNIMSRADAEAIAPPCTRLCPAMRATSKLRT